MFVRRSGAAPGHPADRRSGLDRAQRRCGPALAEMHKQLTAYLAFVRAEVQPTARADFRLPPELYAFNLRDLGVDIAPDELARIAHQAFTALQGRAG
jgi:hypothetical protein